jgi:Flp pilus assembly protein CpaB
MMSLAIAAFAGYMVWSYISDKDAELRDMYAVKFPMVVASRDILQYQTIRPTDIEVVSVPKAMAPFGRISEPKDVIDAVAAVPIQKGEHVLDNKVISKNVYSGLNTQIGLGRRAISIPVNVKSSVAFQIRPGNRVDLAAHFEYKAKAANISEVKVFLQDLLVLAAGKTIQPIAPKGVDQKYLRALMGQIGTEGPKTTEEAREILNFAKSESNYLTVSLEVTPEQAQRIVYVMTVFPDSIILLLRHSDDRTLDRIPTANIYDVMGPESYLVKGNQRPPPRAVPRPKFFDYVGDQAVPVY